MLTLNNLAGRRHRPLLDEHFIDMLEESSLGFLMVVLVVVDLWNEKSSGKNQALT